ncbi:MAG: hypothetical protein HQ521_12040 [Bacteroidetes bacterium]|nr:hypothetical protein [Bacteroidota bacterium]
MKKNKIRIYTIWDFIAIEGILCVIIFSLNKNLAILLKLGVVLVVTLLLLIIFTRIYEISSAGIRYRNLVFYYLNKSIYHINWNEITNCEFTYINAQYVLGVLRFFNNERLILKIRMDSINKVSEIRMLAQDSGVAFKIKAPDHIKQRIEKL